MIKKTKIKKVYNIEDLRDNDVQLLAQAATAPEGTLFCFGRSYEKLQGLQLIDQESNVTVAGKKYLRSLR